MCVLYIVSTTVYAVFNCVCIIRSSVCSVYVSYAAEARGRRMLAANYNRGAAFSLFIIFIISFYWSLCWMFGKFHAFSTLRFWWLLQLQFHFGLPTFSRDLLHLLFAQLVSRRFDSKTVTRMTQGPSVNPDARCTLSEGFAARILSCKWHTFNILATSLSHQKIFLYEFHPTTLFLKTQVEKDSSETCA